MKCFDTCLLIWGIRGEAEQGQEGMIARTKKYIHFLDSKNERIMIPAPALAEFLVGSETPNRRKTELAAVTTRQFAIYPLDAPASVKAAEVQEMDLVRKLVKDGADRDKIKVDAMIVAIAIVQKADLIVSNDNDIFRLAQGLIQVTSVPEILEQKPLPFPTTNP